MEFNDTARYQILTDFLDTYADKVEDDIWMNYHITFKRVGEDYFLEYEYLGIDYNHIHCPRTLRVGLGYEAVHVEEE